MFWKYDFINKKKSNTKDWNQKKLIGKTKINLVMETKNVISYSENSILENIRRETNKIRFFPLNSDLDIKWFEIPWIIKKDTIYSGYLHTKIVINRILKATSSFWKFQPISRHDKI